MNSQVLSGTAITDTSLVDLCAFMNAASISNIPILLSAQSAGALVKAMTTSAPVQPVAVPDGDPLRKALNLCIRIIHGGRGVKEIAWNLHRDIELALLAAPAAQGDAKEVTDERAEFENVYQLTTVTKNGWDGERYSNTMVEFAWGGWKARAAIAAKAAS